MSADTLLSGGGIAGLILALVAVGNLWVSSRREKTEANRHKTTDAQAEKTSAVTDASTANAIILRSLQEVHRENEQLRGAVQSLRDDVAAKDKKITDLFQSLAKAQAEITRIARELAQLTTARDA